MKQVLGVMFLAVIAVLTLTESGLSAEAGSKERIGIFTAVRGQVTVAHLDAPTVPTLIRLHDAVFFRDTIETKKASQTKALFLDDSVLTVGENSRLEITEHIYDPSQSTRSVLVKLARGTLRALVGKMFTGAGSRFEIHTPNAVAAARGTYFVVWTDGATSGIANIGTHGLVEFTSAGQTVPVLPGFFTISMSGGPPAPPAIVTRSSPSSVRGALTATEVKDQPKPESVKDVVRAMSGPSQATAGTGAQASGAGGAAESRAQAESSTDTSSGLSGQSHSSLADQSVLAQAAVAEGLFKGTDTSASPPPGGGEALAPIIASLVGSGTGQEQPQAGEEKEGASQGTNDGGNDIQGGLGDNSDKKDELAEKGKGRSQREGRAQAYQKAGDSRGKKDELVESSKSEGKGRGKDGDRADTGERKGKGQGKEGPRNAQLAKSRDTDNSDMQGDSPSSDPEDDPTLKSHGRREDANHNRQKSNGKAEVVEHHLEYQSGEGDSRSAGNSIGNDSGDGNTAAVASSGEGAKGKAPAAGGNPIREQQLTRAGDGASSSATTSSSHGGQSASGNAASSGSNTSSGSQVASAGGGGTQVTSSATGSSSPAPAIGNSSGPTPTASQGLPGGRGVSGQAASGIPGGGNPLGGSQITEAGAGASSSISTAGGGMPATSPMLSSGSSGGSVNGAGTTQIAASQPVSGGGGAGSSAPTMGGGSITASFGGSSGAAGGSSPSTSASPGGIPSGSGSTGGGVVVATSGQGHAPQTASGSIGSGPTGSGYPPSAISSGSVNGGGTPSATPAPSGSQTSPPAVVSGASGNSKNQVAGGQSGSSQATKNTGNKDGENKSGPKLSKNEEGSAHLPGQGPGGGFMGYGAMSGTSPSISGGIGLGIIGRR